MNNLWGSVPDWVTAIATVVTAVVAIAAAIVGLRQYAEQGDVSKKHVESLRREQASGLVASCVIQRLGDDYELQADTGNESPEILEAREAEEARPKNGRWGLLLRNASRATFGDIDVTVSSADGPGALQLVTLAPGDIFLPWHVNGGAGKFGNFVYVANVAADFKPVNSTHYHVESVNFRDNDGQRWSFNKDGLLSDVDEPKDVES